MSQSCGTNMCVKRGTVKSSANKNFFAILASPFGLVSPADFMVYISDSELSMASYALRP